MFKKLNSFSLVEILVGMIVLSCVIAAFAPVITKRSESSNITIVNPSEKEEPQETPAPKEERVALQVHEEKQEETKERMQEREENHVREIENTRPEPKKEPRTVKIGGSEQFEALSKVVENCRINLDTSELICDLVESAKGEIANSKD